MGNTKTNPYKTLIGQLLGWLHQLPVIGFNSGKYDLNVVKQFFVPYLLKPSKQDDNDEDIDEEEDDDDDDGETRFVIKRQNTFMSRTSVKIERVNNYDFRAQRTNTSRFQRLDKYCFSIYAIRKLVSHILSCPFFINISRKVKFQ